MHKFHLSNKAVSDLGAIWDYTFDEWSEEQADKYYDQILDSCQLIADHPEIGRSYNYIMPKLRGIIVGSHIIFYVMINDKDVEIARVLHGQMDLKSKLME